MAIKTETKKTRYITVGIPYKTDNVRFQDMRIELEVGGYVNLIRNDAGVIPFFAMFSISDIIELAELLQRGEI